MLQPGLDPFTLLGIFIIVIIIIIYLAWMVRYKAKSKERLLIIEKDYDINKLIDKKKPLSTLKTGIILFVSSIGAVFAILIFSLFRTGIEEGVIFFTSIFMFAGIGMIIANKVDKSRKEE